MPSRLPKPMNCRLGEVLPDDWNFGLLGYRVGYRRNVSTDISKSRRINDCYVCRPTKPLICLGFYLILLDPGVLEFQESGGEGVLETRFLSH